MEFEEYVEARGPALLRLAYVLTGDAELTQDLVQSGLANAYSRWGRVSASRHPDAYVRRIIVNEHLNWRRRRWWGERPTVLSDKVAAAVLDLPDHADAIVSRDHARQVLATLPPRARTVLVLRYFGDLDDAAIGAALGITPGAVRSTASRALAALRARHAAQPPASMEERR